MLARRAAPFTGAAVIAFIIWTHITASSAFFLNLIELLAILAAIAAVLLVYAGREGFAFTASTVMIGASVITIFVDLYPNVMVSGTSPAYNLTVHNTASDPYSLKAMTVVVIIFLPVVLAYQAWMYHVFRKRVSVSDFERAAQAPEAPQPSPGAVPEPRPASPPVRPGS
jgi:cytochrome bd ubiquinol oxidase subunit II